MTCEVLSGERFERVLARRATSEDIETLRAHLETACEACLERLADVDDERLLAALAGPGTELSAAEADRMFAAARPVQAKRAASEASEGGSEGSARAGPANRRLIARLTRWPFAAAAALLIAATTGMFLFQNEPDLRDKGPIHVELIAFAAKKIGDRPAIDRRLHHGDRIAADERVLFRHRLSAPAHLHLLVQRGDSFDLLFSADVPAGEKELAQHGQALALDPTGFGPKLRIIAIAGTEAIERDWLACSACGRAELELVVE